MLRSQVLCVNCLDLSSLMKEKSQMIEKLELALEKQQDGRFTWFGITCCLATVSVIVLLHCLMIMVVVVTVLVVVD